MLSLAGIKMIFGMCVGLGAGFIISELSTFCQVIDTFAAEERRQHLNHDIFTNNGPQRQMNQNSWRQDNDWFNATKWKEFGAAESCFHVENICRASHQFFYDDRGGDKAHQPNWKLNDTSFGHGYPNSFRPVSWNEKMVDNQCQYSPIPNHMVLHSWYTSMLGEFYNRILPALYFLIETQSQSDALWRSHTQIYLHSDQGDRDLMDSHKLFLEPFSSNVLLPFKAMVDQASCTCFNRVLFCGYEQVEREEEMEEDQVDKNMVLLKPFETVRIPEDRGYEFHVDKPLTYPQERDDDTKSWGDLQKYLRHSVVDHLQIQSLVKEERQRIIQEIATDKSTINASAWKIVGFTQRNSRRRWLKLDSILRKCNLQFNSERIACVEVNVESKYSNVAYQAIIHNSLDAIIGIHGAQLTEAIWMNDGAAVLELLPFIPEPYVSWGSWTRSTDYPTPLGIIFNGTRLNHVGIRLPERSSRLCKYNYSNDFKCWRDNAWEISDFVVDYHVAERFITSFVTQKKRAESCKELQRRAKREPNFIYILYNYVCVGGSGDSLEVRHFWDETNALNKPLKAAAN